jgi:hypothetical protein
MSETFTLPPGCQGFTTAGGETLRPNSNGTITLEDHHASRLKASAHKSIGLVTSQSFRLGTKTGRWCSACKRLWQAWSATCPRCGDETHAEAEHEPSPAAPLPGSWWHLLPVSA